MHTVLAVEISQVTTGALVQGADSAPELDSRPAAQCRPRQWHVPCWFCWCRRTSRCVPMIAGSLQIDASVFFCEFHLEICTLFLREVHSRCFSCSRVLLGNLCIISTSLLYFQHFQRSIFFARVDFFELSSAHTCECSRAGDGADAGSSLSGVGPPVLHN